jgi:hypothetical protein
LVPVFCPEIDKKDEDQEGFGNSLKILFQNLFNFGNEEEE